MFTDEGRTDGLLEFGHREEDGDEATDDEVVNLLLDVSQAARDGAGRDDGKVVTDLLVVEDAATSGINPAATERFLCKDASRVGAFERLEGRLGVRKIILGQVLGIGTRISESLVLFVQGLGDAQGGLGREPEASITFPLEGREIEEARGTFLLRLALVGDDTGADLDRSFGHFAGLRFVVETFGFLAVSDAGHLGGAAVTTVGETEVTLDFPEGLRDEITDLQLALHDEHERRSLDATDGEDFSFCAANDDGREPARGHADQPVGLGAADGRIEQALLGGSGQQVVEGFGDGGVRHARQPEALAG